MNDAETITLNCRVKRPDVIKRTPGTPFLLKTIGIRGLPSLHPKTMQVGVEFFSARTVKSALLNERVRG